MTFQEVDNEGFGYDGNNIEKEKKHWYRMGFLWKQGLPKKEKSGIFSSSMSTYSLPVILLGTKINQWLDFPGDPVVKNLPANAGDMGLISGPRRSHMPQNI